MQNKREILMDLKKYNINIKKKYGQNFLIDQNILSKIVDTAELDSTIAVIEIGGGVGSLTDKLCQKAGYVLCYEIDSELIPILRQNLKEYSNYEIINQDILKVDSTRNKRQIIFFFQDLCCCQSTILYYHSDSFEFVGKNRSNSKIYSYDAGRSGGKNMWNPQNKRI